MARPSPPYLHRERTRHGTLVWYVRRRKGPRIRLYAVYGSAEFTAEYLAALSAAKIRRPAGRSEQSAAGTVAWLIERYRETAAWFALSLATRRQRENIFRGIITIAGHQTAARITTATIVAGRDRRVRNGAPAQARHYLDAVRGLFRWAAEAQHVPSDITAGIRNPKRKQGPGFKVWTDTDIARYEARWPVGTKERVWLDVLLYTGLRRGDAVVLGRQHVHDGVATLQTAKSGRTVTVTIPLLEPLRRTLEAGPCGDLAFICGEHRRPLSKEGFGNQFKKACRAAGVDEGGKAAHGLRKIGATRAAENGATVAELDAIFGWRGGGMAALYTREANRVRLATGAMDKLLPRTPGERKRPAPLGPKART